MSLIVGNEYYWLSDEQHALLLEYFSDWSGLSDYTQAPDGFWYAEMDAIDMDEQDFLFELSEEYLEDFEWGFLNSTYYSTSTQPGGGL